MVSPGGSAGPGKSRGDGVDGAAHYGTDRRLFCLSSVAGVRAPAAAGIVAVLQEAL
jgi:hypothetical protein